MMTFSLWRELRSNAAFVFERADKRDYYEADGAIFGRDITFFSKKSFGDSKNYCIFAFRNKSFATERLRGS